MTIYSSFRKAVLEEALPIYKEENPSLDYPLEDFLSDFINAGTDDLFNTYDLRVELVDAAFPDVKWRNCEELELPKPMTPEMKAMDEAINDFDCMMKNMFKSFKETSHE